MSTTSTTLPFLHLPCPPPKLMISSLTINVECICTCAYVYTTYCVDLTLIISTCVQGWPLGIGHLLWELVLHTTTLSTSRRKACETSPVHVGVSRWHCHYADLVQVTLLLRFQGCSFPVTYIGDIISQQNSGLLAYTVFPLSLPWLSLNLRCRGCFGDVFWLIFT